MAIERRFCKNHPDRPAIGVCVITRQAICSECSTRYEGVNYSKEGLRILQERRRALQTPRRRWIPMVCLLMGSPLMLWLVYFSFDVSINLLMNLIHREF